MKRVLKWIVGIVLIVGGGLLLILLLLTYTAYRPAQKEVLFENQKVTPYTFDTIQVLSWNIGYAGLDSTMDFFKDGGKRTRQTKEQTEANLQAISSFLKAHSYVDFCLLQEVDAKAHRSYKIDELTELSHSLAEHLAFFGLNYKSAFVPVPVTDPMGSVESGIVVFSRYVPSEVTRHSYSSREGWPTYLFSLSRCCLTLRFPLTSGHELVLVNTHNSAFDDGELRKRELDSLKTFMLNEERKGNYVLAGGDWNHTPPGYPATTGTKYFRPMVIDSTLMPKEWQWIYDGSIASNRFMNTPYRKGETELTLLDFFLCSPNIQCISVQTIDLDFANSDHNPVLITVVLK